MTESLFETTGSLLNVPWPVAVLVIDPASRSACVTVVVAVQMIDAPGARLVVAGQLALVVGFGADDEGETGSRRSGTARVTAAQAGTFSIAAEPAMSCDGDSGGPSFLTPDDVPRLIGVTSFGDVACTAGTHTRAFVAGIRGVTTANANAIPVLVDSAGQLGTVSSSRRFKEDIADMGDRTERLLALRPVVFRYRQEQELPNGANPPLEYGLIAEEVAEVFPDLVVYDDDGLPFTVGANDTAGTGQGRNNRATCVGDPLPDGFEQTNARWFDTAAFTGNPPFAYGTCGYNSLRGPGSKSMNLSIFRSVPLPSDRRLEFRVETFNLFNWVNWRNNRYGPFVGNAASFRMTNYWTEPPRTIQAGLRVTW